MTQYLEQYFKAVPEGKRSKAAIALYAGLDVMAEASPAISKATLSELQAQRTNLKLIASENFCSYPVMLSMGNWLTDKYAEGIPGRRFYAGCEWVDQIESTACSLAKELFRCEHAYVQPHSGADANLVAYWSILVQKVQTPAVAKLAKRTLDELSKEEYEILRKELCSQKMMGMALDAGGHLTHGFRQSISSKMMQSVSYGVDPVTGWLNLEHLREQVLRERPLILVAGYSAYPRRLNFAKLREICDEAGTVLMADIAHFAGLVAGGVFQGEENPIPYADLITSTTHKTLRGPRGGIILCKREWADTVDRGCPMVLGGPLPQVMAAKAIAFQEALQPGFSLYAQKIVENARSLAEHLLRLGVELITGGTDNHLVLLQVFKTFGLSGRQAENALRSCGLTVNRNTVPNDPLGPLHGSGVRIGTPATTTLLMGPDEMQEIAELLVRVLRHTRPIPKVDEAPSRAVVQVDPKVQAEVLDRVHGLLRRFPLYPELVLSEGCTL